MIIPRAYGWMRVPAGDDSEFGKWRGADESLVGIDVVRSRVIDGQQADWIEVDRLLHGIHEGEAEQGIGSAHATRVDLQIFVWIGNVAFTGRDPVTDYAGTNHVGDEFILMAVPGKQNGAGTAAAVEFADAVFLFGDEVDFVLRNACWPEQTHDFDVMLGAEPGEDGRSVLATIARRALHFPLLVQRAGVNFDLGADAAFVVVQRLQVNAHPVVLIAALVSEQKRRCRELCDN